jgi:membrane-bound metal-dependent hydrolase YbcI (DUF457 family)
MALLEVRLGPLYRALLLEEGAPAGRGPFLAAGVAGTVSHVLLDSPLYSDIQPLYPLGANPFFAPRLAPAVYGFCALSFLAGTLLYLSLWALRLERGGGPRAP